MITSSKQEALFERSDGSAPREVAPRRSEPKPRPSQQLILPEEDSNEAKTKLMKLVAFTFTFMIIELIGGYVSNSVAIISDALHMGADTIGYAIQLWSVFLSLWKPCTNYSFGYKRGEVLGGMANCIIIWGLTIYLIYEAILRIIWPPTHFNHRVMLFTATLGVLLNVTMGAILVGFSNIHRILNFWEAEPDEEAAGNQDYNIRITIMHIRGDMAYSVGVLVSAILINLFPEWILLDSICTILFSYVVVHITQPIIVSVSKLIMEGVPEGWFTRRRR